MKVQEQIKNVRKYSLFFDNLYYDNGTALFGKNGLIFEKIIGHDVSEDFIFAFETINGKTYTHLLNDKINDFFEFPFSATLTNSKFGIYWSDFNLEDFSVSQNLFDIEKKMFIKKLKGTEKKSLELLVGDSIYFQDLKRISVGSFHLPTETTLWQYSVADLGAEKVNKILGVYGQTLVVVGQIKENTFVLFGLDVQSGKLLWKHDTVFERNSDGRTLRVKLNLPYADTTSNKIIIFEAGFYIEIEGSSGQILKWIDVFKSPFHYNDLTMDAYAFDISQADEDHIYFRTSVPTYGMYTGAGIFNRKTNKLEFLEIIKNEKGNPVIIGPLKIQATKEKYYVLDTQNTLHIFEREDETPDLNQ